MLNVRMPEYKTVVAVQIRPQTGEHMGPDVSVLHFRMVVDNQKPVLANGFCPWEIVKPPELVLRKLG